MTFPIAFTRGTRAALMMMLVLTGLFWLAPALAQEETAEVVFDSGNVAWMLTSTLLVLLMVVPGLALFYGGMVRSKNVLSVIMQVLVVFSLVILLWIAYGAFSSCGTLAYALMGGGFRVSLSGRANSTLNLLVFAGAFAMQWGMGGLIDLLKASGNSAASAHRCAFLALLALQAVACLWLFVGGRRRNAGAA